MHFLNDKGFVVRRVNYRDADRILTLYTKESGKIEVLAKGVRKITSKRSSHTELLNHIGFQTVNGKRGLVLTQTQLIDSYAAKRNTLEYLTSLFYICELITRLCPLEQKNEDIYDLLEEILSAKNGTRSISYFQKEILTHLGYWDRKKTTTNVTEINRHIESILEKRLNTHKFL